MLKVSSASLRSATRSNASTRLSIAKFAARSYSSGGHHEESSEHSNPFPKFVGYAAPTVIAVVGFWAFVDRPRQNAKAAKLEHKKTETHKEFVEEKEPVKETVEEPVEEPIQETVKEVVEGTVAPVEEVTAVSEEPTEPSLSEENKDTIDLLTADLEQALEEGAIPETVVAEAESITEEADAAETKPEGAFNPETGEINWDCPCLGGMANGPCGEEFKTAFSCFVYSDVEPKGVDCIEKFSAMQNCFREHPDVYAEEIRDSEPFPEENKESKEPQTETEAPQSEVSEPSEEVEASESVESETPKSEN